MVNRAHLMTGHSENRQPHDLYHTPPKATLSLFKSEEFDVKKTILEPCCGAGYMSETIRSLGYKVSSYDKNYFSYGVGGIDFLGTVKMTDETYNNFSKKFNDLKLSYLQPHLNKTIHRTDLLEYFQDIKIKVKDKDVRLFKDSEILQIFLSSECTFTDAKFYNNPDYVITNPPYKYATEFILHAKEIAKEKVAMLLKLNALAGEDRYNFIWKIKEIFPAKKVMVFTKRLDFMLKSAPTLEYCWCIWDKNYNGPTQLCWDLDFIG